MLFTLEKEIATHCSILAWRIPWTEEPCGLQSMGLQRVGHDSSDLAHSICSLQEKSKLAAHPQKLASAALRPNGSS